MPEESSEYLVSKPITQTPMLSGTIQILNFRRSSKEWPLRSAEYYPANELYSNLEAQKKLGS